MSNLLKSGLETPAHEQVFIRQALAQGLRLDGRQLFDYREIDLTLTRGERSSLAEVVVGSTRVVCKVIGDVVTPFPDRPTEGILQFAVDVSMRAEKVGISDTELCRLLERTIKESEAIDLETLCLVSGEKVWQISCNIRILDYQDGNAVDTCVLAAMAALRGFRKPEVTISSISSSGVVDSLIIHSAFEREPLPLALYHTPLSVTLGICKGSENPAKEETLTSSSKFVSPLSSISFRISDEANPLKVLYLLADPSSNEEVMMDGAISFSINAHGEICAIQKTGTVSIAPAVIMRAAKLAGARAVKLHEILSQALAGLEEAVSQERAARLDKLRERRTEALQAVGSVSGAGTEGVSLTSQVGGIDINDPILAWDNFHQAVGVREA